MERIVHAFGVVILVCVGVRVAAWLIEPVLPLLGVLLMFLVLGWLLFIGPRYRG